MLMIVSACRKPSRYGLQGSTGYHIVVLGFVVRLFAHQRFFLRNAATAKAKKTSGQLPPIGYNF